MPSLIQHGLSAHLNTLYAEHPPGAALRHAFDDGFRAVETWAPPVDNEQPGFLGTLRDLGLELVSVNTAAGPGADSFGLLGDPDAVTVWRDDFARTLDFARSAGASAINVLVGGRVPHARRSAQLAALRENLLWALSRLEHEVEPLLLLEPLNAAERRSPLLRTPADVLAVLSELGQPRSLKMLFDVYHVFQETDDVVTALQASARQVGHVQIADYPGRAEPGTGVIDFPSLLAELTEAGYDGPLGLEYFPRDGVTAGLTWTHALQLSTTTTARI